MTLAIQGYNHTEQFEALIFVGDELTPTLGDPQYSMHVTRGDNVKSAHYTDGAELIDQIINDSDYIPLGTLSAVDPAQLEEGCLYRVSGVYAWDDAMTSEFVDLEWAKIMHGAEINND